LKIPFNRARNQDHMKRPFFCVLLAYSIISVPV